VHNHDFFRLAECESIFEKRGAIVRRFQIVGRIEAAGPNFLVHTSLQSIRDLDRSPDVSLLCSLIAAVKQKQDGATAAHNKADSLVHARGV
jgi:hypothetical protein